jgi:CheY-like chemotaxis protein
MSDLLKKILYAEDESDIREIAKIALEELGGFEVKYCENGTQVIEIAKSKQFIPDLVLLDVMMPGTNGPTCMQEIRKFPEFENIPVIFMTAKIQESEIANYKSMGAIDVITKPFDPMTLSETLQTVWKNHKAENYEKSYK